MYFGCFQNMSIKVTPNFEKYGKCLKIFANTNSKCTCIREILPYVRGMKVLLGPCIHRKLYISSRVTPCSYISTVMLKFVQATYVPETFVLFSNILAVTDPILTKLFGPNYGRL